MQEGGKKARLKTGMVSYGPNPESAVTTDSRPPSFSGRGSDFTDRDSVNARGGLPNAVSGYVLDRGRGVDDFTGWQSPELTWVSIQQSQDFVEPSEFIMSVKHRADKVCLLEMISACLDVDDGIRKSTLDYGSCFQFALGSGVHAGPAPASDLDGLAVQHLNQRPERET